MFKSPTLVAEQIASSSNTMLFWAERLRSSDTTASIFILFLDSDASFLATFSAALASLAACSSALSTFFGRPRDFSTLMSSLDVDGERLRGAFGATIDSFFGFSGVIGASSSWKISRLIIANNSSPFFGTPLHFTTSSYTTAIIAKDDLAKARCVARRGDSIMIRVLRESLINEYLLLTVLLYIIQSSIFFIFKTISSLHKSRDF